MTSLRISNPSDRFNIVPQIKELEALADAGGFILWDRDGMVGKIPNVAIRDAVTLYLSYEMMRQRGRLPEVPAVACYLHWDQCQLR